MTRTPPLLTGLLVLALLVAGCTGGGTPPGSGGPGRESGGEGTPSSGQRLPGPLAAAMSGAAPRPPDGPAGAARALRVARKAIADRDTPARVLAAAGHLQQVAVQELTVHPGWDAGVRRRLPEPVAWAALENVRARRELRSMHPSDPDDLAKELPAWRITEPPPARELLRYYREAERRTGVDWEYLAAIHLVETVQGRVDATSVAGAVGPMQFLPTTWEIYGEGGDIQDPHDAILAAGRLLAANGFAETPSESLLNYNNSTAYAEAVTRHARVMQRRPRAFFGFHGWQVYYRTSKGSIWLPEGYDERRPVPVRQWLRRHPGTLP